MTCRKPSSAGSTAPSGTPETNPTILPTTKKNSALYAKYKALADQEQKVIFGGRLGEYKYYDMDAVIAAVLTAAKAVL